MAASRRLAYGKVFLDSESVGELQVIVTHGRIGVHHSAPDDLKLDVGIHITLRIPFDAGQKFFSEQCPPLVQQVLVGQSLRCSVTVSVICTHAFINIAMYA